MKKLLFLAGVSSIALTLTSCATATRYAPGYVTHEAYPLAAADVVRMDVVHVVAPYETLWRLSKMYGVKVEDIMRANNVKTPEVLEMGQRLIIPNAMPLSTMIPLYPSNKWKYIIIHHSATDTGNALSLFNMHMKRGFGRGLGYHFVIANGTYDKGDGQVEISPRWIKQQDGAHCKASGMNHVGIGVCLVGNFSKERVSERQLDALVWLVKMLREYYKIPLKNIVGHGQVNDARTECPGNYFPWREFRNRLRG